MFWQPSASIESLQRRAELLAQIRTFFAARDVLEVDVPVIGATGVTDPHIDCIQVQVNGRVGYLQSSPEYFMKRLLAAGAGPVYYLGKAFRDGEAGRRHSPEFTLLEWYRPEWDEWRLMAEVEALVLSLMPGLEVFSLDYGETFFQAVTCDPHNGPLPELQGIAGELSGRDFSAEDRATCLDIIFSLSVEPQLPEGLAFVHSYPGCQAALAELGEDRYGNQVARRFEAFVNRLELANGYCELTDPVVQEARFRSDLELRGQAGKLAMPLDQALLAALRHGLPPCAGVALGVDRLLMQLLGEKHMSAVLPFASNMQ